MENEKRLTSIQISEGTWNELSKRKELGQSFEDVIIKMMREEPPIKPRSKKKK